MTDDEDGYFQSFSTNPSDNSDNETPTLSTQSNSQIGNINQNELEQIQNLLVADIEIEFAACEKFPLPIEDSTSDVKKERIDHDDQAESSELAELAIHPLFGNWIFETQV